MDSDWFGTPLAPLAGGYSGETFVAGTGADRVVVRIYRRHQQRALVDASLLRLLRGIIPVPEVIEVRPPESSRPAVLVTKYVEGVRLDTVLAANPAWLDWETLGLNLGWILGCLSRIPFVRFGQFADADLTLTSEGVPTDLVAWAQHFRDAGRLAAWSEPDWRSLLALVDVAERTLDDGRNQRRVVLAHSDFNPKNILVDPADWSIAAILDWEFAHAGSIYTDLGNFTRFERDERLVGPMIEGFGDSGPGHIRAPYEHWRATDLWSLLELGGTTESNPVRELATTLLLAQAREQGLDAWPWPTDRVDPTEADAVP